MCFFKNLRIFAPRLFIPFLRICSIFNFYHRQLQSGPWITPLFLHGLSVPCHMLPNILIKRCWMSITWIITAQRPFFSRGFPSSSRMHSLCTLCMSKSENVILCGRCWENNYIMNLQLIWGKQSSYNSKFQSSPKLCCVLNCTVNHSSKQPTWILWKKMGETVGL